MPSRTPTVTNALPAGAVPRDTKRPGPKDDPVLYPDDRRQALWIHPKVLIAITAIALLAIGAAWTQYILQGLPNVRALATPLHNPQAQPGFPIWLRVTHLANFMLLALIIRSGLSILWDHPRLYTNPHCTPGTEWIRFTPIKVPTDRLYTANDDQRYLPPALGLPGYRHTIGMARHWHFLADLIWIVTGLIYVVMLFVSGHWLRIVPASWHLAPQAWSTFVYYITFHRPPEPDGFYRYNALQQIAYFAVPFILAPLSILTGLAMSPALHARFPWFPRLFGGRQGARSLHFLLLVAYLAFLIVHVSLVFATGALRNMNHIVMGRDDTGTSGLIIGLIGIAAVIAACVAAHWLSWRYPRTVQRAAQQTVNAVLMGGLDKLTPRAEYTRSDISPRLWPNGDLPTSPEWLTLAGDDFKDYKLRIHGLVENPVELSLDDLRAMEKQEQTTVHHCIQGWSGIAEWGGVPMIKLMELVKPRPEARVAVFHSFGESKSGRHYYDTHTIENLRHPQSLLAYEMNYNTLTVVYGAPLRLRVENQLGYKMVKWISSIEFVTSEKDVGDGYGGVKQDEEYFDLMAGI